MCLLHRTGVKLYLIIVFYSIILSLIKQMFVTLQARNKKGHLHFVYLSNCIKGKHIILNVGTCILIDTDRTCVSNNIM